MSVGAQTGMVRAGFWLCLAGAALGALGLLGALLGQPILSALVPGRPAMQPNAAVALLLAGIGGALLAREPVGRVRRCLAVSAGAVVAAIGAVTLAEYVFGTGPGIDLLLDPLVRRLEPTPFPGRPSPPTALALTLAGGALVLLDLRVGRAAPAAWLALSAALIAFFALVAHAHGVGPVYRLARATVYGVALPTALSLFLVSAGLLLERPRVGLVRLASSKSPGGMLLRRLGVVALVAPPLLGLVTARLVQALGVTDLPLILAIVATFTVPFAVALLVITAVRLDRMYAALDASRRMVRTLVEQAVDGVFVADLEGRYTDVNAAGCRMVGCSREEIVDKRILDFIPAEDAGRLEVARQDLLAGQTHVGEWHLRHKDGHLVPVEVSTRILPDGRWQAFVRDITARKAAEEETRRTWEKLEGIISISADAIISVDEDQRIVLFNEGAAQIFGWSPREALGQPLDILIPERVRLAHRAHVKTFAAEPARARRVGERMQVFGRRKNGEEFPADAAISKVEVGGSWIFTVVLRDMTQRIELEGELREALGAAREAVQARDQMVGIVAHDLRNPLNSAQLAAGLLTRTSQAEDRRKSGRQAADTIQRSLKRAGRLIDDLLDASRIEAGSLVVRITSESPERLAHEAVELLAPAATAAALSLELDVPPSLPPVFADGERISQALTNLIGNAIKFSPRGGRVRVSVDRHQGAVRFAVADSGPGIPAEDLSRVFDRFWQGQVDRRGAGLGLTIAKGIVEAHGGRIWVQSVPGVGSTFYFSLRIAPGLPTTRGTSPPVPA